MRVDFNVPMDGGKVTDDQRIRAALQSIRYALDNGALCIVLMSHLGRPDGKPNEKYSLRPIANYLGELLNRKIIFLEDCVGANVEQQCSQAPNNSVILLENLRFHPEEEGKSSGGEMKKFSESLSKLGDVYINDAFGTMHRAHSSITGISIPIRAAGFLVRNELDAFSSLLQDKIDVTILGGAKVSDKITMIEHLLPKVLFHFIVIL